MEKKEIKNLVYICEICADDLKTKDKLIKHYVNHLVEFITNISPPKREKGE